MNKGLFCLSNTYKIDDSASSCCMRVVVMIYIWNLKPPKIGHKKLYKVLEASTMEHKLPQLHCLDDELTYTHFFTVQVNAFSNLFPI